MMTKASLFLATVSVFIFPSLLQNRIRVSYNGDPVTRHTTELVQLLDEMESKKYEEAKMIVIGKKIDEKKRHEEYIEFVFPDKRKVLVLLTPDKQTGCTLVFKGVRKYSTPAYFYSDCLGLVANMAVLCKAE